MSNRRLDCDVVCDLIPLYHDGVVSETTRRTIKEHLENCADCRKEYETICTDIPMEPKEMTTKRKFADMMKKVRRKRFFVSAIAVVLICVIVIGGYFLQLQVPAVNVSGNDITVHSAYRYETDEGYKLFVLYSYPCVGYTKGEISLKESETENTLVLNIKKPIFSQGYENISPVEEVWRYEYGYCSGDNGDIEYTDFDKVEFGGNIIWNQSENANDDIPAYVYAYEDFEEPGGDVTSWGIDLEKGYVGAGYKDGSFIAWDLSGNVLYETQQ